MKAVGLQLGEQEGQRQGRGGVPRAGGKGLVGREHWGGDLILLGPACQARSLGSAVREPVDFRKFFLVVS